MGCTTSSTKSAEKKDVNLKVGAGVGHHTPGKPVIIFAFGGPGSKKGCLVDSLCASFDLKLISVEDIIMEYLKCVTCEKLNVASPSKTSSSPQSFTPADVTVRHVQKEVKSSNVQFTLDWVLEMVTKKIEDVLSQGKETFQGFVVDVIPNLRVLLRLVTSNDIVQAMKKFESNFPVFCALCFSISHERFVTGIKEITPKKKKNNEEKTSDEADSSRTLKRVEMYQQSVKGWYEYFRKVDRQLVVDVSGRDIDAVIRKVSLFLKSRNFVFNPLRTQSVLLFGLDHDVLSIDLPELANSSQAVKLSELSNSSSCETLLRALREKVNQSDDIHRSFIISYENTSLARPLDTVEDKKRKLILFVEPSRERETEYSGKKGETASSFNSHYHSISSCSNELCFFPADADLSHCEQVARAVATGASAG